MNILTQCVMMVGPFYSKGVCLDMGVGGINDTCRTVMEKASVSRFSACVGAENIIYLIKLINCDLYL